MLNTASLDLILTDKKLLGDEVEVIETWENSHYVILAWVTAKHGTVKETWTPVLNKSKFKKKISSYNSIANKKMVPEEQEVLKNEILVKSTETIHKEISVTNQEHLQWILIS